MKKLLSIALLLSSASVMAGNASGNNGLPDGAKCRFATDCASGICNNTLSGGLAGGNYCVSKTSGEGGAGGSTVIGGLLADGQHCLTNRQCASGICSSALSGGKLGANVCVSQTSGEGGSGGGSVPAASTKPANIGKLLAPGQACSASRQCASGKCTNGTCAKYATGFKKKTGSNRMGRGGSGTRMRHQGGLTPTGSATNSNIGSNGTQQRETGNGGGSF